MKSLLQLSHSTVELILHGWLLAGSSMALRPGRATSSRSRRVGSIRGNPVEYDHFLLFYPCADSHQNSCWLHSCEAADFVIDCAAKLAAQLIITGGGWKSPRGRARGGPSRRAGGDWRQPRYALPHPTDELLHGRDHHHQCYHDSQSWPEGWWRGGASDIAKKHVLLLLLAGCC